MRLVVALGGHALLRRGQKMTIDTQRDNVRIACDALAPIAVEHELAVTHGNGPQVGLLALQSVAHSEVPPFPLDVLDAETQGMIGYLIERELGNRLRLEQPAASLLTMVEVDPTDRAFHDPTKPIGPFYDEQRAAELAVELGWSFAREADAWRRVVPSPLPKRILELAQINALLERGCVVICAGGGGIPTVVEPGGELVGVEAVVDKDRTSALLATDIRAHAFVITMDVDAVYLGWGTPSARGIRRVHPDVLMEHSPEFDVGSMLPKVIAACEFVDATGGMAVIGGLADVDRMLRASAGTVVTREAVGIELYPLDDTTATP